MLHFQTNIDLIFNNEKTLKLLVVDKLEFDNSI